MPKIQAALLTDYPVSFPPILDLHAK